jgi:hypothetical protein
MYYFHIQRVGQRVGRFFHKPIRSPWFQSRYADHLDTPSEVCVQGCQIFLGVPYQNVKIYTKRPHSIPNIHNNTATFSLKALYPGGIRTRAISYCLRKSSFQSPEFYYVRV